MKASNYTSLNRDEIQQLDQSQFLSKQSSIKSNIIFDMTSKVPNLSISLTKKRQNIISWWKKLLYATSFVVIMIVLILQFGRKIKMSQNRQQNFMSNLSQLKRQELDRIFNIQMPNFANTDQYQIGLENDDETLPNFKAGDDKTLNQYIKKIESVKNKQNYRPINQQTLQENLQLELSSMTSSGISDDSKFLNPTSSNGEDISHQPQVVPNVRPNPLNANGQIPQRSLLLQRQRLKKMASTFVDTAGINQIQKNNSKKWKNLVFQDYTIDSESAKSQRKYYEDKYQIFQYKQIPFCIVVPTFNNTKNNRYLVNIRSIVQQEYENFHIVIIDDASTDNTGQMISQFLQNQTKIPSQRYQIITNTEQKLAMYNLRRAAMEFCQPQEIFLIVDGDDQLLGRQVLHLFNAVFQKNKAWFVYSNFLGSSGNIGYSRPFLPQVIKENTYRSFFFMTSHLRAFYTQLFRNIKEQDLKDEKGEYFRAANDVAICIPILQQSHEKVVYIPEMTYYYNSNTGLNNHHLRVREQKANEQKVRGKPKYEGLSSLMPPK